MTFVPFMDSLNPDYKWLAACLNTAPVPLENPNWKTLIPTLKRHRLIPCFYSWWAKNLPSRLNESGELHQCALENKKRNLILISLTTQIQALCQKLGIRVIHIKGVSLSQRLYNCPSSRMTSDIDILVSLQDLPKLHQELQNLGYSCDFPQNIFETHKTQIFKRYKDLIYQHNQFQIALEVHWKLDCNPALLSTNFERLWKKRRSVTVNNCDLATLSDDDNLIYLAVHGAKHSWRRLQWLRDWAHLQALTNTTSNLQTKISYQLAEQLWANWSKTTINRPSASPKISNLSKYCQQLILSPSEKVPLKNAFAHLYFLFNLEASWRYRWYLLQQIWNDSYARSLGNIQSNQSWHLSILIYLMSPYYLLRRLLKAKAAQT